MNLVVSSITMVDLTNKEAKRISFSPKKNLLTSTRNHLGKSVIMKSIYYTLGAEVYYPSPIKRLNLLTYIDFHLMHIYIELHGSRTLSYYTVTECLTDATNQSETLKKGFARYLTWR